MTKYLATAHYANADISCETYEMDVLMDFLFEHEKTHQDVIDALTGELFYDGNNPHGENFMNDQFWDDIIEWMLSDTESKPDPREELIRDIMEVCEEFGATFSIPQ